jgi:hypothetical protein
MDVISGLHPRTLPLYKLIVAILCALLLLTSGCAHHMPIPLDSTTVVYQPAAGDAGLSMRFAPTYVVYDAQQPHNRIGQPTAQVNDNGAVTISIDPAHAVVYTQQILFSTATADYTNLIYRIHFPKVPFDLVPFNLTAGNNPGVLVVVTLDHRQTPVLVTTVGTCGCYKAIVPTNQLSREALPAGWPAAEERLGVYGEQLPSWLDFNAVAQPRLVVHLRPDVHRVMDLEVVDETALTDQRGRVAIAYHLAPAASLWQLPTLNGPVSMFHESGLLKGHVKGAIKPLETMFMSWFSFDLFVGMDKAYADTGNPFYTSLKPWNRNRSDMWHFERFLTFWGWQL